MRKSILFALISGAMGALAVPAVAAIRHEHKFSMTFTSKKPKSSTGISFSTNRFNYQAPPAGTPADPVTKLVFTLAKGTKINTSVVPACSKSKLEAQGPSACPSGSKMGSGSAEAITGVPALDPVKQKVTLFARKGGLLAFLQGAQNIVIDLKVKGNKLSTNVPRICLIPSNCAAGEVVLKVFTVNIKAKKTSKGAFTTTPARCPKSRKWTNTVDYTFRNGDTERETKTSPCKA